MTNNEYPEGVPPKYAPLVCPKCHSDNLGTIEDISGIATGQAYVEIETGERTFEHSGWTDVCWDSSTTVGIECRDCFWFSKDPNWEAELVLDPKSDAAQMHLEVGDAPAP